MTNKPYIVSELDMLEIFNLLTYDYYASLQRRLWRAGIKRRPLFVEYVVECKRYVELESISPEAWYAGYTFVADLFEDNERNGSPCDKDALFEQQTNEVISLLQRYK